MAINYRPEDVCTGDPSAVHYFYSNTDPPFQNEQLHFENSAAADLGLIELSSLWGRAFFTETVHRRLDAEIGINNTRVFQRDIYKHCETFIDYMRSKLLTQYMDILATAGKPNSGSSVEAKKIRNLFELSVFKPDASTQDAAKPDPQTRVIKIRGRVDGKGIYYVTIDDTASSVPIKLSEKTEVMLLVSGHNEADNFTEETFKALQKEVERILAAQTPVKVVAAEEGKPAQEKPRLPPKVKTRKGTPGKIRRK